MNLPLSLFWFIQYGVFEMLTPSMNKFYAIEVGQDDNTAKQVKAVQKGVYDNLTEQLGVTLFVPVLIHRKKKLSGQFIIQSDK